MRLMRSGGAVPLVRNVAISACSLLLGLAQLYLLVSPGLDDQTDAYFFVLAWATVPIQLLLLSIFYPSTLRAGVMGDRARRGFLMATVSLTVLLSSSAALLFGVLGPGVSSQSAWIATLCCLSTVVSIPVWAKALELSASGRAAWLSAINLAPSLAGIALLAIAPADLRVESMLLGQAVGFLVTWVLLGRMYRGAVEGDSHPSLDRSTVWLSAQSVAAYVAILALQSGTATLPSSSLSLLGIATRCVSAGASLASSSVLPLLTNRSSSTAAAMTRFIYLVTAGTFVLCSALLVIPRSMTGTHLPLIVLSLTWLCSVVVNQGLHRWAFRSASARLSGLTILVSLVVVVALAAIVRLDELTLSVVLALFISLDLLGAVLFGIALGQRRSVVALIVASAPAALVLMT